MKRIHQTIRKEFIQIKRDRGLLRSVALMPLIQLLIYGYVVATEIRALPMAVLDYSPSTESRRLADRFVSGGYFKLEGYLSSPHEADEELNSGHALIVLVIPHDFAENVRHGKRAKVQLLIDGTNSNTATIALGYVSGIVAAENSERLNQNFQRQGIRLIEAGIVEESRVWFNPSLRAINYMVPGIICILLMEMMVPLIAFSLVRERERGTIEQLMVTPLRDAELLVGKLIPYALIGLADSLIIVAAGTFWFGVPVAGNFVSLFACCLLFIIAALGLGILLATMVKTQQQAALSSQFVIVPNLLLSGFMFAIESMPTAMQYVTTILPMRYFLVIVRGIMMKGLGIAQLWDQILALAVLGAIITSIGWMRFRRIFA
jgi:ABC-2 type transport system permease protein